MDEELYLEVAQDYHESNATKEVLMGTCSFR